MNARQKECNFKKNVVPLIQELVSSFSCPKIIEQKRNSYFTTNSAGADYEYLKKI